MLRQRAKAMAVVLACAVAVTACGSDDAPSSDAAVDNGSGAVATGLRTPWGIAFLPDGTALVGERDTGRILRIPADGGTPVEAYRIEEAVHTGEGGLLGLAVSPSYATDKHVFAYYTSATDNRVVRFTLDDDRPTVILDGITAAANHDGGRIAFGPDGFLYIGTGDAGEPTSSQDPDELNGKILRVTADGRPAPGNPRPGSPVWSLGHRNVQGLAWDSAGRLYATEFGQNTYDEVNRIEPGRNCGWPEVEGRSDTGGGRYTDPLLTWATSDASPSGAAIVGSTLYVGALRGERLWVVPLTSSGGVGTPRQALAGEHGRLRTVVRTPDGGLWVSTSNTDGRGDVRSGDDRILRVRPE